MNPPDPATVNNDHLMLWVMHSFAANFKDHAILKGGMQLMLMSSLRATNDIDYVFSPFKSKKEVENDIDAILNELPNVKIEKSMHSNTGRYLIEYGKAKIQIEFNVDENIPSEALTTQELARKVGELPRIIRVMAGDVALSHKLAAWNERRLLRDLYDVYYWFANVGVKPDMETLTKRLGKINSRLPKVKKIKKMTLNEFVEQIESELDGLDDNIYTVQLSPLIPKDQLVGSFLVFRAKIGEVINYLKSRN